MLFRSCLIFCAGALTNIVKDVLPIQFRIESAEDPNVFAEYTSKFYGPNR